MTEHETTRRRLDFEALRHAIELRDPETMLGFYADDAQVRVINGDAPHGPPFELRGKTEISRYLRAVFDQDMTHLLGNEVASEDRIAFSETCEYPDGTRVVVRTTLELREGEIAVQVDMVAQDTQEAGKGGERRM